MFRWLALTILIAGLGVSAYHRRLARQEGETIPRLREPPLLVAARALVALPLAGGILAYLIAPRSMQWATLELAPWIRWAGVGLGFLMVPLAFWVFRSIGRNVSETVLTKTQHELVTHGPYRWIRHPLYTMGVTLILAIGLMAANWFILVCGLAALASVRLAVVPVEERALLAAFGERYRDYMQHTGAMWPRMAAPDRRREI
jgi:protein-S-isoprenylcysteine O-methyltransferase Ste14